MSDTFAGRERVLLLSHCVPEAVRRASQLRYWPTAEIGPVSNESADMLLCFVVVRRCFHPVGGHMRRIGGSALECHVVP